MAHRYDSLERKSSLTDSTSDLESVPYPVETKRRIPFVNVICFALLSIGWILYFLKPQETGSATPPPASYARPSLTPLPSEVFEVRKQTFNRDDRYVGFNNEVNHNWDHLVAGHDALWLDDPEKYGLPDGEAPPFHHENMARPAPEKFYVVSVLHQLHCLNMIRVRYFINALNLTDPTPDYSANKWEVHVEHCFEYLRQAISCGSLFAIEGETPLVAEGEEGLASTVTGWGVEHDCFNFEALRVFQIEQERRYNATWSRG